MALISAARKGRSSAAERVDRFYERAAELIQSARSIEVTRGPDPLVEALGNWHASMPAKAPSPSATKIRRGISRKK
jgi:hypothetical protein